MLYLNTARGPFPDPAVRTAMQYAVDKSAQVTANGGPALNDVADRYLPPILTAGTVAPVYDVPPTGDPALARKLLAKAGKTSFGATLTVSTGDKNRAEAIQASLAKVGVKVQITTVDASVFYDTIGDTAHAPDMTIGGWCPDYPSASTFLPFVFDGRTIVAKGNQGNYSQFRDPSVEHRMDQISTMANADEAAVAWKSLDAKIMHESPAVPLLWPRKPLLVGTNIAGAYGHSAWTGQFDFASIGLKDPSKSQG
jgi:peptide/nickel transport system substrate-binding protein